MSSTLDAAVVGRRRQLLFVEQVCAGRDNNFNLLRMLAASAVLVSHAWPLALGHSAQEPLEAFTGYKLGTTAVTLFFAISGFFITKSFDTRASTADFIIARVARIYPALLLVLILTVAVLGPLFTTLPLGSYFSNLHTLTYVPRNLSLRYLQFGLPGVFESNAYDRTINGSLWTLYFEVSCYALVVLFGLTRVSRPATFPLILLAAILPIYLVPQFESGSLLNAAAVLTFPFALGAAAYVYRRYVPVSGVLALVLLLVAVLSRHSVVYPVTHALALSYGALWFGFARVPRLRAYNRLGDYSYGMYIYAFPIEQIAMAVNGSLTPRTLTLVSFPPTLLLAVVSWTWIEAPALAHRHFLKERWRRWRIRRTSAMTPLNQPA